LLQSTTAFEIFGPVSLTRGILLDVRQDGDARSVRPVEVRVEIVDMHQDSINDPWNSRPLPGLFASLPMVFRAW
jgi:hypothetical protein